MNTVSPTLEVSGLQEINTANKATRTIKYNSIDILRLLCAIMVVAIHTQPLTEYNNILGYFATFIFPRLGVPFFFAVSGYFYINGLLSGKNVFVKYIKRLLTIYVIWSFIYYLVDFLQVVRSDSSILAFIKRSIINFFISGSHYQLWFFPALIFCVVIVTVCRKHLGILTVLSFVLYLGGCLVGAYYKLGSKIPLINSLYHSGQLEIVRRYLFMGLPFFLLGYVLLAVYPKLTKIKDRAIILASALISVLFLSEILFVKMLKLQSNIIMTIFLYPLLALVLILCFRYSLPKLDAIARFSKVSANFMYYAHPLYMFIMGKALTKLFSVTLSNTLEFVLICASTVISAYVIFKLDNKILNKLVQ